MPKSESSVSAISPDTLPTSRAHLSFQHSDTTVPDLLQQLDNVERASGPKKAEDPFSFRSAYKDDAQLSDLRKRRKGKDLEYYHRRQNNVTSSPSRRSTTSC